MKGAPLLAILIGLAVAAGAILHTKRNGTPDADQPSPPVSTTPAALVARHLDLPEVTPSPLQPVSQEILTRRIGDNLEARFGTGGLAHRTRAYELLTLLPTGQNLHRQISATLTVGVRGWFDDLRGELLVLPDFAPETRPDDRATLLRLRTRERLFREGFALPAHATDDQWIAHRALHGALAQALQLAALPDHSGKLPTSQETEREAILLSLPVYTHNLASCDELLGLPYLRRRREAAPTPWLDLLRSTSGYTQDLLDITAPIPPAPTLPNIGASLLEESLGAYSTQLLLERHSDYELAESLTPQWRGDRYRLFSNAHGDHLVWHCQWATAEAANRAAEILRNNFTSDGLIPGNNTRHASIETRDSLLLILNCSDPVTLIKLKK